MCDSKGVVHDGRDDLSVYKQEFANTTNKRTVFDACEGSDVFIGVSGANLLSEESLMAMAPDFVVFAMANPDPEIVPEFAKSLRDDVIMATDRSGLPKPGEQRALFPVYVSWCARRASNRH